MGNILASRETVSNPFKYAGEVYDQETGLYYLKARYYDPVMGRFLNEDSVEGQINNPLSLNLYTYCINNPLMYNEPSGNVAVAIPWAPSFPIPFVPDPIIKDMLKDLGKAFLKLIGLEYSSKSTVSTQNPPAHAPHPAPAPPQAQKSQIKPDGMYTNGSNANSDKEVGKTQGKSENGYVAPDGGGGKTDEVEVGETEVTFGHGGRHLGGTGLSVEEVMRRLQMTSLKNILELDNFIKERLR